MKLFIKDVISTVYSFVSESKWNSSLIIIIVACSKRIPPVLLLNTSVQACNNFPYIWEAQMNKISIAIFLKWFCAKFTSHSRRQIHRCIFRKQSLNIFDLGIPFTYS